MVRDWEEAQLWKEQRARDIGFKSEILALKIDRSHAEQRDVEVGGRDNLGGGVLAAGGDRGKEIEG